MKQNRSTMEVLASILGLIIFIVVIMGAMNYFRQGTEEYMEAQRVAGRPITLAESISGSEALTETVAAEGATTAVTDTAVVTTTEVAATAALTTAVAVTTTSEATVTTSVTDSTTVTDSAPIEVASAVTTSEIVTESTAVAVAPTVAPTVEPTVAPTEAAATVAPTAVPTEAAPAAAPAVVGVPAAADVAPIFAKGTCVACHVIPDIPGAVGVIGPDLTTIGAVGATRIAGYTAEEYIRESILNPNAFIAPECPTGPCLAGVMLQNLADILTPEEIDLVVAYLAAQGVQ